MSRIGITLQGEDTDPLALPAPDQAAYAGQWAAGHGEYRIAQAFMSLAAALEAYEDEQTPVNLRCSQCGHIGTPYVALDEQGAAATGFVPGSLADEHVREQRGAPADTIARPTAENLDALIASCGLALTEWQRDVVARYFGIDVSEQRDSPAASALSPSWFDEIPSEQRGAPVDAVHDLSGPTGNGDADLAAIRDEGTKKLDGSHAPQRCGVNGCGALIRYEVDQHDVRTIDDPPGVERTIPGEGRWVHVGASRGFHAAVPAPH